MRTSVVSMVTAALGTLIWTSSASAQTAVQDGSRGDVLAVVRERTPDVRVLTGGALLFGIPYTASVVVASRSGVDEDRFLYVPVAGPWIDLVARPECPPIRVECSNSTATSAALVGDGILQAAGTALVIRSFVSPEKTWIIRGRRARATLAPVVGPTTGFAAVGSF